MYCDMFDDFGISTDENMYDLKSHSGAEQYFKDVDVDMQMQGSDTSKVCDKKDEENQGLIAELDVEKYQEGGIQE